MTLSFFHNRKITHLDVIFTTKKKIFILFIQVLLFYFNAILKSGFKNLEKLKKW